MKYEYLYKISNVLIQINNINLVDEWEKFKVKEEFIVAEDILISLKNIIPISFNKDIETVDFRESLYHMLVSNRDILLANDDYSKAYVLGTNKKVVNIFLCYLFCTRVSYIQMIQLHSSLIDYKGKGILFLGPSGIGKTTQAELWNKYRDALIINGDIVFVQETEENFLGWGTPWHGSSPYCENTSVPVHAMIVLKQESENSIRELTGFEKVTAVSNNVFYPQWLENGMELCLETLDHLLSAIPVYELSCRPDEEAVRLTEETLFGN